MADGMRRQQERDEGEGDAAQAFKALQDEVAALRHGIELVYRQVQAAAGAPAATAVPAAVDYSPTLGAIAKGLQAVEGRLKAIEGKPALGLTPAAFVAEIRSAGLTASEQGATALRTATSALGTASEEFKSVLGGARARGEQDAWIGTAAVAGVIAGVLLWYLAAALLPWGAGHWLAASLVGGGRWEAGSVLLQEADPKAWDRMVQLDKACGDSRVALCEAAIALWANPPVAQAPPAPEAAKPAPPAAAPAPLPSSGRAGVGR